MSKLYKLGVIGSPIDHSLSPFIHSRFGRQENINLDYRAYKVEDEDLHSFIKEFFLSKESKGLNITLPHKKATAKIITSLSKEAAFIDAVNTIIKSSDKLHAVSTDGEGLIKDLVKKDIQISNKKILIIGAGAAVESVLFKIIKSNPQSITLSNRSEEKAKKLCLKYSPMMNISLELQKNKYDLVINGSSAGLTGDFLPPDNSLFNENTIFYDLNYSLTGTAFCNWAEEISSHSHDGMGMLISQAALSFNEWFGVMPSTKGISKEIRDLRN
jgi:shikimate dehydrogenase|tara:strand:+ start:248 stop:1060 length:813 start_codon:yes stop_codon:yes gene_type:complete